MFRALAFLLLFTSAVVLGAEAVMTRVIDGDTIEVGGRVDALQAHVAPAGLIAHNLAREAQIETQAGPCANLVNRASLWFFHELSTLRRRLL